MKFSTRQEHGSPLMTQSGLRLSRRLLTASILLVAVFKAISLHAQAAGDPLFIDRQGQVGIGTNQPAAKLDINGSAVFRAKTVIASSNGSAQLTLGSVNGDRLSLQYKFEENKHKIGLADRNGRWGFWSEPGNGNAYIAGNLGVGQPGATAKLDVVGDAKISGSESVGGNETVTGNIGVGGATPGFPLSFPDSVGDKISLYGQSGNHYGFGIRGGQLQIHTAASDGDIVFGYGKSDSITETMRIKGNQDVIVRGRLFVAGKLAYYWRPDNAWKQIEQRRGDWAGSSKFDGSGAPAPSDLRLKRDLHPIPSPLDKIRSLRGVTYRWNADGLRYLTRDIENTVSAGPDATAEEDQKLWRKERGDRYKELGRIQVGIVAQDVESVLPEAVATDVTGYKLVRYDNLIPLLVEALKEEDKRSQKQARTIRHQQDEIRYLAAANESARSQLAELEGMKRTLAGVEASMKHFIAEGKVASRKDVGEAGQTTADDLHSGTR